MNQKRNVLLSLFTMLAVCFMLTVAAYAAPIQNFPVTVTQPDGTALDCLTSGDEFFNYLHDSDGNVIMQSPDTGFYVYAELDTEGKLTASATVAENASPLLRSAPYSGIKLKDIDFEANADLVWKRPEPATHEEPLQQAQNYSASSVSGSEIGPVRQDVIQGSMTNIVIMISFAGESNVITDEDRYTLETVFNGQEESLKDYMQTISDGKLTIDSILVGMDGGTTYMYQDVNPRSYYEPYNEVTNPNGYYDSHMGSLRGNELLDGVLAAIDDSPLLNDKNLDINNDGIVDIMTFFISGSAASEWGGLLWPHAGRGYRNEVKIGGKFWGNYILTTMQDTRSFENEEFKYMCSTICHESLHILSFEDFYRYSFDGESVGAWDVMSGLFYNPQIPNMYSLRRYAGWGKPIEEITEPGRYTLSPRGSKTGPTAYAIRTSSPSEFILIEYLNANNGSGYDGEFTAYPSYGNGELIYDDTYDPGLLVSRVNKTMYPFERSGDEVYVYRPEETGWNEGGGEITKASLAAVVKNGHPMPEYHYPGTTQFGNYGATSYEDTIYLYDGTNTNIYITDVSEPGETISFTVNGQITEPPIVPFEITLSSDYDIPEGQAGTDISPMIDIASCVSGGVPSYMFSKSAGPDWITVSGIGNISGTRPATAQEESILTIMVTDSVWSSTTFSIKVGAVIGTTIEQEITGVSVDPTTAIVFKGGTQQFAATVTVAYDAPKDVLWTVTGAEHPGTGIDETGLLTVSIDETAGSLTVRATSVFDSSQFAEATVSVAGDPDATVTLSKEYIVLQATNERQLDALNGNGQNVTAGVVWASSNPEIASVESGLVKAIAEGTAIITATSQKYGAVAECRVDVTANPVQETVQGVKLLETTVTSNVYSENYAVVPLQLVLPQNMNTIRAFSGATAQSATTHSIESVTLLNNPGYFEPRIIDDRYIELAPTQTIKAGTAKSLKTGLSVRVDGRDFVVDKELTIKITRTYPTLRATAIKFGSFFPNDPKPIVITTNIGKVTSIVPDGSKLDNAKVVFDNDTDTLRLLDQAQRPKKLAMLVTVDEFPGTPFPITLNTSVSTAKPAAKLNVKSVTMNQSAELTVTGTNIAGVTAPENSGYVTTPLSGGKFTLSYVGGGSVPAKTVLTLTAGFTGTDQTVPLKLTVNAPGATTVSKLSKSTVTLNQRLTDDKVSVEATMTPVDAAIPEPTGDTAIVDCKISGKIITLSLKPGAEAGKNYRLKFGAKQITIKSVYKAPVIKLKAKGTLDILNPDSAVTLTPTFTNYNYQGTDITINNTFFQIASIDRSTGAVTLKTSNDAIKATTRQTVVVSYADNDGNMWHSYPINITPKQGKITLTQSTKQIKLQGNDGYSEGQVDIAVKPPTAAFISEVKLNSQAANLYSIREVQNGRYAIGFKDKIVCDVGKGTNVKLDVYFEGLAAPVSVTVKVVVS